jgi:pyruvate,orthophosphate dikinase
LVIRDDAGKFLPIYIEKGILKVDPFEVLDQEGVGQLVKIGTERGRSIKPNLKVGICGEHGGEPSSVEFCYNTGMDYVSCSPYRVPIARLVSAQAAIKQPCKVFIDSKKPEELSSGFFIGFVLHIKRNYFKV